MRIDLLGPIRVRFGDEIVTKFQTQKTAALLAFVATHPGRAFPREQVAELLWPDGDPVAIRNRLNQAVSSLRRQLEPFGVDPLISDAQSIGFKDGVANTDIQEFQELLQGKGSGSEETLRQIVKLYRGDFLEGADEEWAVADRVKLLDGYIQSLTKLMKLLVEAKRFDEAIDVAHQRLEVNVRDERNHRALMKLFLLANRPSAAMAQFRELETILAKDGAAPSARARELFQTASRAGETDAEVIFPEEGAGVSRRVPVLPAPANRFVGRETELAKIQTHFDSGARIVALVGIGGIGKSRLACEYGWRVADRCQHRVIRIEAVNAMDESKLAESVSRAFFGAPQRDMAQWPAEAGECLLILDEAEGYSVKALDRLLACLPGLRVIWCGRHRMNQPSVPEIEIGPLENQGRELFEARAAGQVDPELIRSLNGIPLAIELAAGLSRQTGRLDAFVKLPVSSHDRGETTLQEVIQSSLANLFPDKRKVLEVLAAWPEALEPEAIDAILPDVDVLLALDRLENRALVAVEREADSVRFRILPLIQLAVDSVQTEGLAYQLAEYFESRLDRIWPFTNIVARDLPNYRAAAKLFRERREPKRAALIDCRLATSLYQLADGGLEMDRILGLLAEARSDDDPVFWASLQTACAEFPDRKLKGGLAELESSAEILAQNGRWIEWAANRIATATILARGNQPEEARATAESVLDRDYGSAGAPLRARAFMRLGHIAVDQDDDAAAERAYNMALSVEGSTANPLLTASIHDSLANLCNLQGKLDEARRHSLASLIEIEKLGYAGHMRRIIPLHNLADTERLAGNYERSFHQLEEAYSLGEIAPMRKREHLQSGASLLVAIGDDEGAAQLLGAADRIGEDHLGRQRQVYAPLVERLQPFESSYKEGRRQTYDEAVRWLGTRGRAKLFAKT